MNFDVQALRSQDDSRINNLDSSRLTAWEKVRKYSRRLVYFRQMDFQLASWQMLCLLAQPQAVYKNFLYRKRSKDQYARDDPAFLVLLAASLIGTSILYAFCLGLSLWGFIKFVLWVIFVDCISFGAVVATILWFISNKWMRKSGSQEDVEWGYAFDVHLNAFFPFLIFVHGLLPIIFPMLIDYPTFMSRALGNGIWILAAVYYVYITFLGYTAIPYLRNTHYFLYPMSFLLMAYVGSVTAGWNISQTAMALYHARAEHHNLQHTAKLYDQLKA
ncbi:unnamed protein product, partial [Mesorhabditis spiculigera]